MERKLGRNGLPPASRKLGWSTVVVAILAAIVLYLVVEETPAAAETSMLEAEKMRFPKSAQVVNDAAASGRKALMLRSNGAATGKLSGVAERVIVRAKGAPCAGAPRMIVRVDGRVVMSRVVGSRGWGVYAADASAGGGTHSLSVSYANDRSTRSCDRNLLLDTVRFESQGTPTPYHPAPAPAPPPASSPGEPAPPVPPGFVSRSGTGFVLDGEPFVFVGANLTNTAGDPDVHECGPWVFDDPDAQVEEWFARMRRDFDGNVLRIWMYQGFTNGGTDWRGFDRTVRLAKKYGFKIVPVLENQWPECSEGGYKLDSWYAAGYKEPYGRYPISFKEYTRRVVERYKDEPTVAAWMLMNEAEGRSAAGKENSEALYAFTRDMTAYVKSIDRNHLVTLGTIGSGQPGTTGADFERLGALETVDFLEYHDYARNDEPLPGAPLKPKVPLNTGVFAQDANWNWTNSAYRQNGARSWETFTYTVPAGGAAPFRRIGLNLYGAFSGDVYVDDVRVGSRTVDFEDGTTGGFAASAPVTLAPAEGIAYAGRRSLKLSISRAENAQAWIEFGPEVASGTKVSFRVYVDDAGSLDGSNDLAAAMYRARKLNKPIIVGEAGMTTCRSYDGSQVETPESRARKFDAKMDAFFGAGGAGYLVWVWHPDSDCAHEFTTGDPLNEVLKRYAWSSSGDRYARP